MTGREQLDRYAETKSTLEATQVRLAELEHSAEVEIFHKQLDLLRRRLLADPQSFRQMFISEGMEAIAWEFQQEELSGAFTQTFWKLLLPGDDVSLVLQRFVWNMPLRYKRKFIRGLDVHMSERYPLFAGLSTGWPGENGIPPYMRSAEVRSTDFEVVDQG